MTSRHGPPRAERCEFAGGHAAYTIMPIQVNEYTSYTSQIQTTKAKRVEFGGGAGRFSGASPFRWKTCYNAVGAAATKGPHLPHIAGG